MDFPLSTASSIAHVADLHFGAENKEAIEALTEYIRIQKLDGLVIAGDVTQNGTHFEFRQFLKWAGDLDIRMLSVPGNHDTPMYGLAHRISRPFRRYREYTKDIKSSGPMGGFDILGINTARGWQMRINWAEGSVRPSDLTNHLQRASFDTGRMKTLLCHHPFLPPSGSTMKIRTRRGLWASKKVAQSPVELVLAGHVHTPTAEWQGEGEEGYLAVTAGTLSTRLRRHPPSFNVLHLEPTAIEVKSVVLTEGRGLEMQQLGKWPRMGTSAAATR